MAQLNLTHTTNSEDPSSLLSLSGLATPKVQPLPVIEGVSDAVEKRNNYSVLRRNLSGSALNSSFGSTKNTPTKIDPNTFQSPLLSSLYTPKTLDSSEKLHMFPNRGKNMVESRVLRLNVDKLTNSDVDGFLNNSSGGYSQSNSAHRNSPVTTSAFRKNQENKSRFQVPILKTSNLGNDYSREEKFLEDLGRPDSYRGEERNSARNRTPQKVIPLHKTQSSNMPHFYNFQPDFEPFLSAREHISRAKDVLLNMPLLDRLLSFFECADLLKFSRVFHEYRQDKNYKSKFKHALNKNLLKGITSPQQYLFWDNFIKFSNLKHAHPTSFTQNFVRKCNYIKDIRMDVDRTFPEYDKYSTEEGKGSLLRVLVAVSNSIAEVGYIQGMNSISGVFLFYMKEEQSFWATLYLLEKLKVKNILNDDFKTVHLLNYQFESFLQNCLPAVANHLKFQSITLSYITTPWFITLYSYSLPLPLTVKLWNFLFIKGHNFLIQFALAVFAHYESAILGMDPDEVPIYLKSEMRDLSEYNEILFIKALSFKVTKEMMKDLAYFYDNGKPALVLEKTHDGKMKWERADYSIKPIQARLTEKTRDNYSQNMEHKSITIDHRRKHSWDTLAAMKGNSQEKSQNIINIIRANFPEKANAPGSFESAKKPSHAILPESLNSSQYSRNHIPDSSDRNIGDQDILHLLDKTAHKPPNHTDARPIVPSHFKKADLYVDNRIHYASSFSKEPSSFAPPVRQQNNEQYLNMKRNNGLTRTNSLASWGAMSAERNRGPQSFANDPAEGSRGVLRETKPELDDRYFSINPLVNFGPSVNSKGNPDEYQSIPKTLVTLDSQVQIHKGRNPFKKSESFNIKGRPLLYRANE